MEQLSLFRPDAWPQAPERPAPVTPPALDGCSRDVLSRTRRLQELVAQGAGLAVRLVVTDNRHTLLSWRPQAPGIPGFVVRAHHMFLDASDDVALALGRWLTRPRGRQDGKVIDEFMAARRHLVTRDRRPPGQARGAFHDLERIFQRLNAAEFGGQVQARIGWGEPGAPRRRRRRSIQLGCFDPDSGTIVIHPALDQAFVPEFFVASVVFHEMLHELIPATAGGGRRVVHPAAFTRREQAFPLTAAARAWELAHVDQLLAYRKEGRAPGRGVAARQARALRR